MTRLPHVREVTWYLPMRLYHDLAHLRDMVKTPTGHAKWATVEALAAHLLTVGAQALRAEIIQRLESARLVQPVAVMPKKLQKRR